jgi:Tol biopolymer transport system component
MLVAAVLFASLLTAPAQLPGTGVTFDVGLDSAGRPIGFAKNGYDDGPSMSADTRWVAFPGFKILGVGGDAQIYVRERFAGTTQRVTSSPLGAPADGHCWAPAISADGRFVAYQSLAQNLVTSTAGSLWDFQVLVHDRQSGTTEYVSVDPSGQVGKRDSLRPRISHDGRFVAFTSGAEELVAGDTNNASDVFLRDRQTGATTRINVDPNGQELDDSSRLCDMTPDGRFVLFVSFATNLVSPPPPGHQVYLHDRQTGLTELVSVNSAGAPADGGAGLWLGGSGSSVGAAVSHDGRIVSFTSASSNLAPGTFSFILQVYARDRQTGLTEHISSNGAAWEDYAGSAISPDGRHVVYQSAYLGPTFMYLVDRMNQTEELINTTTNGIGLYSWPEEATVAAGGRRVLFEGDSGFRLRDLDAPSPKTYCPAAPLSVGCTPALSFAGKPSVQLSSGFVVRTGPVLNHTIGQFFYGASGATSLPFGGSVLCVRSPLKRVRHTRRTGGAKPPKIKCNGSFDLDFNAYMAAGSDPALIPGVTVWLQGWIRDTGFATLALTDALAFEVLP